MLLPAFVTVIKTCLGMGRAVGAEGTEISFCFWGLEFLISQVQLGLTGRSLRDCFIFVPNNWLRVVHLHSGYNMPVKGNHPKPKCHVRDVHYMLEQYFPNCKILVVFMILGQVTQILNGMFISFSKQDFLGQSHDILWWQGNSGASMKSKILTNQAKAEGSEPY